LGIGQERSLSSAQQKEQLLIQKRTAQSFTRKKSQSEGEKHLTFFFTKGIKENFFIII
jgi:hypothetical protein